MIWEQKVICPHEDRPNVNMPPLAPMCHYCAYDNFVARGRPGFYIPNTSEWGDFDSDPNKYYPYDIGVRETRRGR